MRRWWQKRKLSGFKQVHLVADGEGVLLAGVVHDHVPYRLSDSYVCDRPSVELHHDAAEFWEPHPLFQHESADEFEAYKCGIYLLRSKAKIRDRRFSGGDGVPSDVMVHAFLSGTVVEGVQGLRGTSITVDRVLMSPVCAASGCARKVTGCQLSLSVSTHAVLRPQSVSACSVHVAVRDGHAFLLSRMSLLAGVTVSTFRLPWRSLSTVYITDACSVNGSSGAVKASCPAHQPAATRTAATTSAPKQRSSRVTGETWTSGRLGFGSS